MSQFHGVNPAANVNGGGPKPTTQTALLVSLVVCAAFIVPEAGLAVGIVALSHSHGSRGPRDPGLSSKSAVTPPLNAKGWGVAPDAPYTSPQLDQMRKDAAANNALTQQWIDQMNRDNENTLQALRQLGY